MLSFEQFLTEGSQRAALQALDRLTEQHGALIPCRAIFSRAVDHTQLGFGWKEINEKQKAKNYTVGPVATLSLISTQKSVTAQHLRKWITMPDAQWKTVDEQPVFAYVAGKYYIFDGHHRTATAILLSIPKVVGEIVRL